MKALLMTGFLALPLSGCAYTFTNTHIQRPAGVQTVAVEAIYDTSREVLPHEVLWDSLQDAFAADGHLKVVPQAAADALVRAHIKQAAVGHVGTDIDNKPVDDPKVFDGTRPNGPRDFKVLTQAGKYRTAGALTTVVEVEVWNLRTRTLLMKHTYSLGDGFQSSHYGNPSVGKPNDHLRFEEAKEASFQQIAQNISRSVVRDLLVR
jgi:hypothetical protein